MGLVQAREHPEAADPVADEVHGILGVHHALAEPLREETLQRLHRLGAGLGARDQLDQPHHPDRIEEMGHGDVAAQAQGQALGDGAQQDAGGVAADHSARPAQRLEPAEQRALGREVLDDRLADPVGRADRSGQIVLERARRDQVSLGRVVEHRRATLDHAGQGLLRRAAAHVQQRDPAAGLRAERRDAAAHGPGAEHRDQFDPHASPPTDACST